MSSGEPLISLLYEAINTPYGLVVETDDAERLRQKLYPLRKTEPDFAPLAFVISPFNGRDLWIVRNPTNAEE